MSIEVKIRRMTFSVFYKENLEFQSTAFSSGILLFLSENRFKHLSLIVLFLKSHEYTIKKKEESHSIFCYKI